MALLLLWTRIELRRRWRTLVVLSLPVAVSSGVAVPGHRAAHLALADLRRRE